MTPDGPEQGGAGAGLGARPLLRTTTWTGHQPGAFERVLYKVGSALRPLIAARLTEEHSLLFGEPVTDTDTGEVHWYSPIEGEAVPYADLEPKDQTAVDARVNKLLFDLLELARKLQAEPKLLEEYVMGQLLELQLDSAYSEKGCLYLVGYQPVFAFWAFESGQTPTFETPPPPSKREQKAASQRNNDAAALAAAAQAATAAQSAKARTAVQVSKRSLPSVRLAVAAGILLIVGLGAFGLSPRGTVVSWLDRFQTIRAHEEALLRIIARDERARIGIGVSQEEIEAEMKGAQAAAAPAVPSASEEAPEPVEVEPEPPPPFDSAKGPLSVDKIPGLILILHFWSGGDGNACGEITSFVSMVTSEGFDPVRELGGEAYLVSDAASVDQGSELLQSCGVQDPFPLRDPGGAVLSRLANAKAPLTVIYDKPAERVLATYPRRDWLDPAALKELQRLFLMQAF